MEKINKRNRGRKKNMQEKRIIEREYLDKFTSEELVTKIIASKLRERGND